MREKKTYLVITFATTTSAMAMEDICRQENMEGRIIPVPKEITAGCGLAWRSSIINHKMWNDFILHNNLSYEKMQEVNMY